MKRTLLTVLVPLVLCANAALAADPFPSWSDGPAKQGMYCSRYVVGSKGEGSTGTNHVGFRLVR